MLRLPVPLRMAFLRKRPGVKFGVKWTKKTLALECLPESFF